MIKKWSHLSSFLYLSKIYKFLYTNFPTMVVGLDFFSVRSNFISPNEHQKQYFISPNEHQKQYFI